MTMTKAVLASLLTVTLLVLFYAGQTWALTILLIMTCISSSLVLLTMLVLIAFAKFGDSRQAVNVIADQYKDIKFWHIAYSTVLAVAVMYTYFSTDHSNIGVLYAFTFSLSMMLMLMSHQINKNRGFA